LSKNCGYASGKQDFVPWNFLEIDITYQKHDGLLHFATDAWTSPNHRAYILVTVHIEYEGEAICLILDVVDGRGREGEFSEEPCTFCG
jgi:hypothetical protein